MPLARRALASTRSAARALFAVGAALLGGCEVAGSRADPDADFAAYRSFALLGDPAPVEQAPGEAPPRYGDIARFLDDALRAELTARGWAEADDATADVLVAWYAARRSVRESHQQVEVSPYGYAYPAWADPVRDIGAIGRLVLDLVDRRSRRLVWRGWTERDLDERAIEDASRRAALAREAVADVLARYPR